MAVTSQLRPAPTLGEVCLRSSQWQEAGLLKASAVKARYSQRSSTRLVMRQLGVLQAVDQAALGKAIDETIG